jgi:hypothetical protein
MTPAQIGCLIEPIGGAGRAHRIERLRWELMLLRGRMAALLVVLALAGCAHGTTGQAGTSYAPYSPENSGIRPEHGGGDGGGGGGAGM